MKLKEPEGNVIIVFEPEDFLHPIVSRLLVEDDDLIHVNDPAALHVIIEKEEDSIALLIALDETEPYDTLKIIESYQKERWFEAVSYTHLTLPTSLRV